jgi:hypothetical protein
MEKKKSVLEEALLDANLIQKTFEKNAKEILVKTMKPEISKMISESIEEDEEDEMDSEVSVDDEMGDEMEMDSEVSVDDEMGDEMEMDSEVSVDDEMGDEMEMDSEVSVDDEMGDEMEMDSEVSDLSTDLDSMDGMDTMDSIETIDATSFSDSELTTIFKKIGPDDEVEVVRTGNTIELKDNSTGSEYMIKLGENEEEVNEDDIVYEIEMTEEEMTEELEGILNSDDSESEEIEMGEAARTKTSTGRFKAGNRTNDNALNRMGNSPKSVKENGVGFNKIMAENRDLKRTISELENKNEEYVSALKEFRNKLHEVAIFNANLTYAVRLFTENTTSKNEKVNIIKRFDDCKTINESKKLYKTIISELNSNNNKQKRVLDEKINDIKETSVSKKLIKENNVYEHPEMEKIKKLMVYTYKK